MGFGKPKYGSNSKPFPKNFAKGSTIIRILPPLHSCADDGRWAVPHTQHFGYTYPNPSDPSKKIFKTFYCIEKSIKGPDGRRVITKACPECALIRKRKAEYDARNSEIENSNMNDDEKALAKEALLPLVNWLSAHNRDFKWYINVKDSNGDFWTARVGSELKSQLDTSLIPRLVQQGVDPIDADGGVWFTITKEGSGFKTKYTAEISKEVTVINGEPVERTRKAPLTEQDYLQAEEKCLDLKDVGIQLLSEDKIQMLVDSGGDENVVKAIFMAPIKDSDVAKTDVEKTEIAKTNVDKTNVIKASQKADEIPVPVEQKANKLVESMSVEELQKKIKALEAMAKQAKQAEQAGISQEPVAVGAVEGAMEDELQDDETCSEMSEEDFLKQFLG